jgi:hypothetical protein
MVWTSNPGKFPQMADIIVLQSNWADKGSSLIHRKVWAVRFLFSQSKRSTVGLFAHGQAVQSITSKRLVQATVRKLKWRTGKSGAESRVFVAGEM